MADYAVDLTDDTPVKDSVKGIKGQIRDLVENVKLAACVSIKHVGERLKKNA